MFTSRVRRLEGASGQAVLPSCQSHATKSRRDRFGFRRLRHIFAPTHLGNSLTLQNERAISAFRRSTATIESFAQWFIDRRATQSTRCPPSSIAPSHLATTWEGARFAPGPWSWSALSRSQWAMLTPAPRRSLSRRFNPPSESAIQSWMRAAPPFLAGGEIEWQLQP
jgi:hypothetical protein